MSENVIADSDTKPHLSVVNRARNLVACVNVYDRRHGRYYSPLTAPASDKTAAFFKDGENVRPEQGNDKLEEALSLSYQTGF